MHPLSFFVEFLWISTDVSSSVICGHWLKYQVKMFADTVFVFLYAGPILIKRLHCSIRINKSLWTLIWAKKPVYFVWGGRTIEECRVVDRNFHHTWAHCDGCIYCIIETENKIAILCHAAKAKRYNWSQYRNFIKRTVTRVHFILSRAATKLFNSIQFNIHLVDKYMLSQTQLFYMFIIRPIWNIALRKNEDPNFLVSEDKLIKRCRLAWMRTEKILNSNRWVEEQWTSFRNLRHERETTLFSEGAKERK